MKAKLKEQTQLPPPRSAVLKEAATGKEREDAFRRMDEAARRVSARAKAAGLLTDEDVARFINEP